MIDQLIIGALIVTSLCSTCVVCTQCCPCAHFFGALRFVYRNTTEILWSLIKTAVVLGSTLYVLLKIAQYLLQLWAILRG